MRKTGLLALVFVGALAAAPAYAQVSSGIGVGSGDQTDILHMVEQGLVPTISGIIVTVLGVLGTLLFRKIDQLTGLKTEETYRSIEAAHRDALQSAVSNAVGTALAKYGPSLKVSNTTPEGQMIVNLVKQSVPDAVQALEATDQWIINTANAKLALDPATPTPVPTSPPSGS